LGYESDPLKLTTPQQSSTGPGVPSSLYAAFHAGKCGVSVLPRLSFDPGVREKAEGPLEGP